MKPKDIPNLISFMRILLVVPVIVLIINQEFLMALVIFVIAGVSDGIDGFLAKHYSWQSRLGSILDPIADKLLLVCSFVTLSWVGMIPVWLVVAVFVRDFIIVLGAAGYHFRYGKYEMEPSFISKFNTFMQILLVTAILSLKLTAIPFWVIDWMVMVTLLTIVLSGLNYVIVWGRKAYRISHNSNAHD